MAECKNRKLEVGRKSTTLKDFLSDLRLLLPPSAAEIQQSERLSRLDDQTGANATGADAKPAHLAVSANMTNRLQIGIPQAFRLVIGVTHIIANVGCLPAEFTFPTHEKASFPIESVAPYQRHFTAEQAESIAPTLVATRLLTKSQELAR
jgi:hypothetical protein